MPIFVETMPIFVEEVPINVEIVPIFVERVKKCLLLPMSYKAFFH